MLPPKEFLASLRDPWLDSTLKQAAAQIKVEASLRQVPASTLELFIRLHAPYVPRELALETPSGDLVKMLSSKAATSIHRSAVALRAMHHADPGLFIKSHDGSTLRHYGGRLILEVQGVERNEVSVATVPADHGIFIQENLHYIGSARTDTILHLGIHLGGAKYPIAYCAISPLDRRYLHHAMEQAVGRSVPVMEKVCVMTRSFGYHPMPKNTMSKLYAAAAKHAFEQGYEYMITALNPYLGFSGATFLGSSFAPFATSPMPYSFTTDGMYVSRRSTVAESVSQQADTPPIAWLCRGLTKANQRILETTPPRIYPISMDEYSQRADRYLPTPAEPGIGI